MECRLNRSSRKKRPDVNYRIEFHYGSQVQVVTGDDSELPGGKPDSPAFLWMFLCMMIAMGFVPDVKEIP